MCRRLAHVYQLNTESRTLLCGCTNRNRSDTEFNVRIEIDQKGVAALHSIIVSQDILPFLSSAYTYRAMEESEEICKYVELLSI